MVRISAIIPTLNNGSTIARAVESVLVNDFDGLEVIIVDDGSSDSTPQILQRYSAKASVIRQRNRGTATARNAGVRASHGEYLAFLDADDEWLPGKIAATLDALDKQRTAVVAYSDFIGVSPAGERSIRSPMSGSPSLDDILLGGVAFFPSVVVMRRTAFEACGGFCEEFLGGWGFEDTYMGLLAREQGEFVHVNRPLVVYYDSSPFVRVARYRQGFPVFARLVRRRYGPRGKGLIRWAHLYYAYLLKALVAEEAKRHNFVRASLVTLRAIAADPRYVGSLLSPRRLLKTSAPR